MSSIDQPKAVIYTRVSTNTQEDNYSFPFQLEACRNYAQQHGMMVVAEFQETASGATLNRPDLEQARAIIRAGDATVLIAYNTDRLSRNLGQLIYLKTEIKHHGGSLHYATRGESTNDAGGDLFENIEDAFAEYERQKIRDRLYTGRMRKITGTDAKPAQVYGNGNCPYGYRYEGFKKTRRIVIDEIEATVVKEMYRL
jgi:site-specific DNA recombinase